MIFGRSPAVNRAISVCSYIAGFAVSAINIIFSRMYFESFWNTTNGLLWWTTWAAAIVMGIYEAFCIGLLTTPTAWSLMFKIPDTLKKIQNEMQRKMAIYASSTLAIVMIVFCFLVYWADWVTTIGGLNMGDVTPARFLTGLLVFGSEIMFLSGNALAWLALIGRATSDPEKKKYQDVIRNSDKANSNGSVKL